MSCKTTFFCAIYRTFVVMKKVIVMGASSGMGQALATLLYKDGWIVGVAARRIEEMEQWKLEQQQLNPSTTAMDGQDNERIFTAQIDVCAPEAPQTLLDLIHRMGGIDLYIHASGIGRQNPELQEDIELNTVETNGVGFTRMIGTAYRYMAVNGGGQIAVISSIAGVKGLGAAPAYSATKALQNTYIQALEQLANNKSLKIRFTDLRPGFVDTALLKGGDYPMMMNPQTVARHMLKAIYRKRHVCIIDWKWRILVSLWQWLPRCVWRHFRLVK